MLRAGSRAVTLSSVNGVAPGPIESDVIEGAPLDGIVVGIPKPRVGRPEKVAASLGFLFLDGASCIPGRVIRVKGEKVGNSAQRVFTSPLG